MVKVIAKAIKVIDGYAVHIFSRKHSGSHDNKYVKVLKNGTIFAKYLLLESRWESLSKTVPKNTVKWILGNVQYILEEINKLDQEG